MPGRDPGGCIDHHRCSESAGRRSPASLGNQLGWYEPRRRRGLPRRHRRSDHHPVHLPADRRAGDVASAQAGGPGWRDAASFTRGSQPRGMTRTARTAFAPRGRGRPAAATRSTIAEPEMMPAAPASQRQPHLIRLRDPEAQAPAAARRAAGAPRSARPAKLPARHRRRSRRRARRNRYSLRPSAAIRSSVALGRVGRGDQHRRDAGRARRGEERAGLDQRDVGDEDAVDARPRRRRVEGVAAPRQDEIGVGEEPDRDVRMAGRGSRASRPKQSAGRDAARPAPARRRPG